MASGHAFNCLLQVNVNVGVVQNSFWMHTNIVVDDEFKPRQAHAVVGNLAKVKRQLRVAHIHHDFDVRRRHGAALNGGDFSFQQTVIHIAGITLGAADCDQHAVFKKLGRITTAHHRRYAQLARNDGGVAGTATAVGHDGGGTFHDRLPVGVSHVSDQHIACLHLVHVLDVPHNAHGAGANFLADCAAFNKQRAFGLG